MRFDGTSVGAVIACFGMDCCMRMHGRRLKSRVATSGNALGDFGIVHHVM